MGEVKSQPRVILGPDDSEGGDNGGDERSRKRPAPASPRDKLPRGGCDPRDGTRRVHPTRDFASRLVADPDRNTASTTSTGEVGRRGDSSRNMVGVLEPPPYHRD